MPEKMGNGGHGKEAYDPETGKYVGENQINESEEKVLNSMGLEKEDVEEDNFSPAQKAIKKRMNAFFGNQLEKGKFPTGFLDYSIFDAFLPLLSELRKEGENDSAASIKNAIDKLKENGIETIGDFSNVSEDDVDNMLGDVFSSDTIITTAHYIGAKFKGEDEEFDRRSGQREANALKSMKDSYRRKINKKIASGAGNDEIANYISNCLDESNSPEQEAYLQKTLKKYATPEHLEAEKWIKKLKEEASSGELNGTILDYIFEQKGYDKVPDEVEDFIYENTNTFFNNEYEVARKMPKIVNYIVKNFIRK